MQFSPEHLGVSPQCLERLGLLPYTVVALTTASSSSLRCVGRVLPYPSSNNDNNNNVIAIHPTLFAFFHAAYKSGTPPPPQDEEESSLRLAPWQSSRIRLDDDDNQDDGAACKLEKVQDVYCVEENVKVQLKLKCIYTEQEEEDYDEQDEESNAHQHLANHLADRCVQQSAVVLVECRRGKCTIVMVESIIIVAENHQVVAEVVRLPFDAAQIQVQVSFGQAATTTASAAAHDATTTNNNCHCPGYTTLQTEISHLFSLGTTSRPSGLLLTGSPGVGKTRLVQSLPPQQHWIRLSDVLWHAMGKTVDELVAIMLPRRFRRRRHRRAETDAVDSSLSFSVPNDNKKKNTIVVVDNVQVLAGFDDNPNDTEKCVLLTSLLQVMEQCVQWDTPLLAIANTATSDLPADLIKAGRLEKEICMEAPTLWQRQEILQALLQSMGCTVPEWAEALASTTAGCVAGDLRQVYVLVCFEIHLNGRGL